MALAIREGITAAWRGTASELLGKLTAAQPPKDWPSTPQGMGGSLARAAPALRSLGWVAEPPDRARNPCFRQWNLVPPGEGKQEGAVMERTELLLPDLGKDVHG